MNSEIKTPVTIYARYSTDRQDARSIDDQVRRCREYAARHGMTVVSTFADEALSGAHTERPQLQQLLQQAGDGRRRSFSAVLIYDLSRPSRDLWDMGRIVFQDLATLGIPVIDVMTQTSNDAPHARRLFASLGMGNDQFLQMVKAETHRGLEGRALAGFWTGGRVYGYSTMPEENPQDPEHPRARPIPIIDEQEGEIVRRIFKLFSDGESTKAIAALLNQEGVPAP
jgi:DNA invertase Pin-like site-specific DNA recombinase